MIKSSFYLVSQATNWWVVFNDNGYKTNVRYIFTYTKNDREFFSYTIFTQYILQFWLVGV